jgi:voltage-gated sodium channel
LTTAATRPSVKTAAARQCRRIVDGRWFDPVVLVAILANAVALGLETYDGVERQIGPQLHLANDVVLGIFVVELLLRLGAHLERPASFFRSGWNVFDFIVVAASFTPGIRENATCCGSPASCGSYERSGCCPTCAW